LGRKTSTQGKNGGMKGIETDRSACKSYASTCGPGPQADTHSTQDTKANDG
jgi:hypothetical protein